MVWIFPLRRRLNNNSCRTDDKWTDRTILTEIHLSAKHQTTDKVLSSPLRAIGEGRRQWLVSMSSYDQWAGFSIVAADASAQYAYLSSECRSVKVAQVWVDEYYIVYMRRCRPLFINYCMYCGIGTQLDVASAARRPVATPDMGWV